ncbi:chaperone modulator CbpM [Piscinibacter sp.]|jgi:chaperone modulatory protein CbpM|uniref:chaperone modulator CbpM n=1 Tax=Piscinibacter sp. TaxID=1903157 RepID=UPI002F4117EE
MSDTLVHHGSVVEEELQLTLVGLCHACRTSSEQVVALVEEGVLEPAGRAPHEWQFSGPALRRARAALRLGRDLQLNAAGVALALDLLDEIETLRSRLRRAGRG